MILHLTIVNMLLVVPVYWKLTNGDRELLRYDSCQLAGTCVGKTTQEVGEGSRKIVDVYNSRPTFTTPLDPAYAANESSTEAAQRDISPAHHSTTSKPIVTTIQLAEDEYIKSEASEVIVAVERTAVVDTTKADKLISAHKFKTPDVYSFILLSDFYPLFCKIGSMTKVKDMIYILCHHYSTGKIRTLRAYDDSIPHDLLMMISVDEIGSPQDMVSFGNTRSLYVHDSLDDHIWRIDTNFGKVDKWLSNSRDFISFTVVNNSHLLLLTRSNEEDVIQWFLEKYDEDAKLVETVLLPDDLSHTFFAIQKPSGEFVVSHSVETNGVYSMCVSFLGYNGRIFNRFILVEDSLESVELFIDEENHDLFAILANGGKLYQFYQNIRNWTLIGQLSNVFLERYYSKFYYDSKKILLIIQPNCAETCVKLLTLRKN